MSNVENLETRIVETTIEEVTVFTNRAMVGRRGKIELPAGITELVVTNLPILLEADSVRASGQGNVAVKMLGVRTEKVYSVEAVAENVAELEQQLQSLERQTTAINNQLVALNLQRDFVKGLGEKSVERFSQGLARQQIDLSAADSLLGFVGERWNKTSQQMAALEKERGDLEKQLTALRQKLQQLRTPRARESFSLFATVEAAQSGEFELEVSYFLYNAGWTPLYDLRVDSQRNKVNLSYLAEVTQRSGEDWNNVQLTLSTAKPGLGALPPKLDPWYINVFHPAPPVLTSPPATGQLFSRNRIMSAGGPIPPPMPMATSSVVAFETMAAPAPVIAESVTATMSSEGGVVTFKVGRRSDIPSDGQPHKTTIFADDYNCELEFISMPKLVTQTYLRAAVANGNTQILPGQANVFRDNNFIGKVPLPSVAPHEEIKLNLGIDESVKVERELTEREVDKTFVSNQRRTTYAYRITLTNLQEAEVQVAVTDQLPVSLNEQVKVKLTRTQPLVQMGELGVLEWKVTLPPKAKRVLYFQFTVEHPRDITLNGLGV